MLKRHNDTPNLKKDFKDFAISAFTVFAESAKCVNYRQSKTWTGNAGLKYATSFIRFILNPVALL